VILLFVVFFFAYSMFVILRQRRLSEVRTDFINNMTHELKTPISTIALSTEVLLSGEIQKEPERLKQYAEIIKNENDRLRMQVEKVLQIATLDKGEVELKSESVNMHLLIEKALVTLKILAQEKGGELHADFAAKDFLIKGDKVHLTNVVYNIIDNAIKYSTKPIVRISTSSKGRYFNLQISDNGKGLSKEDCTRIFEKFYRVSQGNVHDVKGFGLGLYYVKRIVESHKGKVEVESELGKGSTFTLKLPYDR
jgi:two-component system phosphate regulon sensor histidine kinase PhoR